MGILARIARILNREGVRGVVNRARHTPLRSLWPQPAPPRLDGGVRLVDHGYPEYTAAIRAILAGYGIALSDGGIAWHVGIPPAGEGRGAVVVVPPDLGAGAPLPRHVPERAALVLDHDPARLERLGDRRPGHPHVMALPPPSGDRDALARAIGRVLILAGALPASARDYRPDLPVGDRVPRLCLGLPEHPARLRSFRENGLPGFHLVEGLRRQPGWVGAASSYRQIARALLDTGHRAAIICQDDAGPGPDFARRLAASVDYWQASGADLFSGLVTDVDDSFRITRVVRRDGMTFVHLNRSIGLVCSMFGARALERLASWDEGGQTVAQGTIDRYLGATPDLDVVTCLPFLVRHRDGLASSVWGFRNGRYNTLIGYSEKRLARMVAEFEKEDTV